MSARSRIALALSVIVMLSFGVSNLFGADSDIGVLDERLVKIKSYEFGDSRLVLSEIFDFTRKAYGNKELMGEIEKRFVKFLETDATLASKQFVCQQLRIMGTEESVPILAEMLTKPATSDMARFALEPRGSKSVRKVLAEALAKAKGKTKIGIINSLGRVGDCKSAAELESSV